MKRFIKGECRTQTTLLPESIDDFISDTNPVRIVDVFVDELELAKLGFDGMEETDQELSRTRFNKSGMRKNGGIFSAF